MKKMLVFAALFSIAPPALAELSPIIAGQLTVHFKAADKNKDGKLTKAGAKNGMPRIFANYDAIDAARRGFVTLDQIKTAVASYF